MENNLLSICIPTYNRGNLLAECITRMIEILDGHDFSIYISDNASPDNTEEICHELSKKYSFIHYFRHRKNIGPENNFEYVLKMPTSKYRWLMSDTTYIQDLGTLFEDLETNDYDAYIINTKGPRASYLPHEIRDYSETISLLDEIGWHTTWISSMIYNKHLIESLDFGKWKASSFNQMAILYEPTANKEVYIRFNPGVILYGTSKKESAWHYHVFDVFYKQLYLFLMSLPLYYPYESKINCLRKHTSFSCVTTLRCHFSRWVDKKWIRKDLIVNEEYIKLSGDNYTILWIISFMPQPIGLWLRNLKNIIKNTILWLVNLMPQPIGLWLRNLKNK